MWMPTKTHVDFDIDGVKVRPGDVIFADNSGVVVIPRELLKTVADAADENGKAEGHCRERILAGEKLQSVWPAGGSGRFDGTFDAAG